MRKVLPYLGASLSALAMAWSAPSQAQQNKFQDVPDTHWAYQAVTELQQKGILIGYPDGYFRGKRTLTRYEFAVALQRALATIMPGTGPAGPPGPQGEAGPAGPPGPPGMTPEEVENLRRLTDEFRNELTGLGANVRDINNRLDQLARDVADIRDRLARMIQFSGDAFWGFRSDRSRYPFYDYSGAARPASQSYFSSVDAPHDFHLVARGNITGGARFTADLVASNYLSYRNSAANTITTAAGLPLDLGGPSAANQGPLAEQVGLYQAQLDIPIGSFGSNTVLTLGRFKHQVTPLTYWRPDTDAYFDLPWYDDGNWVQDGFRLSSKFGSATTSLWAGSYQNTGTTAGGVLNAPQVGALYPNGPRFLTPGKPTDFNWVTDNGSVVARQTAGFHLGIPLFHFGEVGLTLEDFSAGPLQTTAGGTTAPPFGANTQFGNVVVYGANLKLNPIGRILVNAEAAKSVMQRDISTGNGLPNDDNDAFLLNVGYNSGPIRAEAGYQYIDPRFAAPGYWNKIGNWYDPTNVRGPFVRLGYNFSHTIQGYLGGDFLEGARNRGITAGSPFGFTIADNATRATAGVKWNITHMVNLRADYEGVFWDLSAPSSASGFAAKPVEQYITLGAGLNLTSNTVLKLAYQIISVRDVGGGFGYSNAAGITGAADLGTTNASVFTTQVAVHF